MEVFIQVLASGLTLGAMYAVSTVGLSLVWGALGMLNMAHGAILTFGGYVCYYAVAALGLPLPLGLPAAMLAGALIGLVIYHSTVRTLLKSRSFETTITNGRASCRGRVCQYVSISVVPVYLKKK